MSKSKIETTSENSNNPVKLSQAFPNLINHFSTWDKVNFSVVTDVLTKHFGDIFLLRELDNEAVASDKSSYWYLFTYCMEKLKNLRTEKEVIQTLVKLFDQDNKIKDKLAKTLFIPGEENKQAAQWQIGLFEKLATGQHNQAKALSYLDIKRVADWMNSEIEYSENFKYHVTQLSHLPVLLQQENDLSGSSLSNQDVYFINVSEPSKKMPKWIVLDLSKETPRVFCESLLSEREKLNLEQAIDKKLPKKAYLGGDAAHAISSGYVALSWANDTLHRTCSLTAKADFSHLLSAYFSICCMDVLGDLQTGDKLYCDKDFYESYESSQQHHSYIAPLHALWESFISPSILGKLGDKKFPLYDFSKALPIYQLMDKHDILQQKDENTRTLVNGLDEVRSGRNY